MITTIIVTIMINTLISLLITILITIMTIIICLLNYEITAQTGEEVMSHLNNSNSCTALRTRRLQCWGKLPGDNNNNNNNKDSSSITNKNNDENNDSNNYKSSEIPIWLDIIINELINLNIFNENNKPNNILINQYQGDQGILHHTDGPRYYDKGIIIIILI